ncbi:MAG: TonB-dependent receptor family protein [Prevotella sp.]|nr:TonB-dependent receptor family protein [Prevotella sp.]
MELKSFVRRSSLTAVLLFAATIIGAQTTLKGVVIDKAQGAGEPFATVRVFKQGNTTKAEDMFLTDVEGVFSHEVNGKGRYDVVVSSLGKNELKQTVELTGSGVVDMGTLYLTENPNELEGVTVIAQKPLVKMETDKMTYNVKEDEDSKVSTVLDMLRKVPMVTVDGQDNISVNGSSSFKVYVDGKPNVMFSSNPSVIFKSMPAAAVKSIEVVTNPGAKYDAEGAGGVLNIILDREMVGTEDMNGYNGTLRAEVGNTAWGGAAFLSGQQGRLTYSANILHQQTRPGTTKVSSLMDQQLYSQSSESRTKTKIPFTMGSMALSYELDSMSSVSLSAEITSMNMKNTGRTETGLSVGYGTDPGHAYGNDLYMKSSNTSFSGSLDYQRFFNKERTSWVAVIYQLSYDPTHSETRNDFDAVGGMPFDITDRYSDNHEKTTEHTLQMDYTKPFGTGNTINTGAKLMMRKATSDAKYYLANVYKEDLSMDYEHHNNIGALYAEYEGKWGIFGAKAGLRYEHTWQDIEYHLGNGQDFKNDYGTLVPSASVSITPSPMSNIGLTYNMRISRPGITYLNPYVDRSSPTAKTYGNSDLDVEKTHNVALVFNAFSQKIMLNLNLSHNFTDNGIEQYSFDDGMYLNTTYGNIVKRHLTGLNGYVNWLVFKDTRLFVNGGVSYVDLRSDKLDARNNGWQANFMGGLQQTLPWKFKLGAYLIGQTKSYTLQGWSGGANLLIGMLTRDFFNDKLTLGIQGLTGLSDGGCLKIETMSRGKDFINHMNIRVPIYRISFTATYAFGNTKKNFQQMRRTSVENDFIEQKSQGEMIQGAGNIGN